MNQRAFSLIELLVVITIIGVLTAIAVPTFRNYSIKAKIGASIPILRNLVDELLRKIDSNQSIATSVTINGTTFTNGIDSYYPVGNVMRAQYFNNASGVPSNTLLVCIQLKGLDGMIINDGGSAYVAPTQTTAGTRSQICEVVFLNVLPYKPYCGDWGSLPTDGWANGYLPLNYLPPGCTCARLSADFSGCT